MSRFKRMTPPSCACGCGESVKWCIQRKQWNIFIFNHHRKGIDKYSKEKAKIAPLCICGCGEKTTWNANTKRYNKCIRGHSSRVNPPMKGKTGKDHSSYGTKRSKEFREAHSKRFIGRNKGVKRPDISEIMKGNQFAKGHNFSEEECEA